MVFDYLFSPVVSSLLLPDYINYGSLDITVALVQPALESLR